MTLGGLAFVASAVTECQASRNPTLGIILFSACLNPLFFVGVPLGVYWVRRGKRSHPLAAIASGKPVGVVPSEEHEQPVAAHDSDRPGSTVSGDRQMLWRRVAGGFVPGAALLGTCTGWMMSTADNARLRQAAAWSRGSTELPENRGWGAWRAQAKHIYKLTGEEALAAARKHVVGTWTCTGLHDKIFPTGHNHPSTCGRGG